MQKVKKTDISKKEFAKLRRWSKFFEYGFCVSLVGWTCGMCFAMFSEASAIIRLIVIVVTLVIYICFVIGKAVMETMLKDLKKLSIYEKEV